MQPRSSLKNECIWQENIILPAAVIIEERMHMTGEHYSVLCDSEEMIVAIREIPIKIYEN